MFTLASYLGARPPGGQGGLVGACAALVAIAFTLLAAWRASALVVVLCCVGATMAVTLA